MAVEEVLVDPLHQQQFLRALEIGVPRLVPEVRRLVFRLLRPVQMMVAVGVAPVEDAVRNGVGPLLGNTQRRQQAEQQLLVGVVQVDLAVLVGYLDGGVTDVGMQDDAPQFDVQRLQFFGRLAVDSPAGL